MKNKFKAMKLNKKFIMKIIIFLILSLIVFLGYILIKNLCNNEGSLTTVNIHSYYTDFLSLTKRIS